MSYIPMSLPFDANLITNALDHSNDALVCDACAWAYANACINSAKLAKSNTIAM